MVGLILALAFTQLAVTTSNNSYDIMADINRDGIVDANDLARLGNAYGSSLILASEPNKTVVTVLSFDKEPPRVENSRVAIIDPEVFGFESTTVDVDYTNSSGRVAFGLSSDKNYTAIAWSGSAYNYANFTTNSLGEASLLILLGEPSLPPIHSLPPGWIVVTVQNNETGSVIFDREFVIIVNQIEFDPPSFVSTSTGKGVFDETAPYLGVVVIPPDWQFNEPHSDWGLVHYHATHGYIGCHGIYSPDENGCANVIVYVTPP